MVIIQQISHKVVVAVSENENEVRERFVFESTLLNESVWGSQNYSELHSFS